MRQWRPHPVGKYIQVSEKLPRIKSPLTAKLLY